MKYINDIGLPLVQVLFETTDEDTVLATYTYGNDLISSTKYDVPNTIYYNYDGLGSVRQLTDDTETVVAEYTYDAFGNVIASSGTTDNTYGFTGEQQFSEANGLVFLRARYYDSSIGRFISRDPVLKLMSFSDNFIWYLPDLIGTPENLNPYVYVTNNPIKYVDPNGLAWWDPTSWNTTNYCGWTKSRSDKAPRSKIDACCKDHDECLAKKESGSCWKIGKKSVRDCHKDFVKCIAKIK